ncbi:MAG: Stress responsive alpha-beta barrel domain protein Dabb [uncultured Sulfurovum sp.]|uniref:Stress responsive alpha-beta barrel domain protein Dabb n=1 Tax=uncultured Sulfurovum sp. TaxID=269237 RepID=A0A6S6TVP1_9BACT|nr:MAG: Stress responsive alpha-beta barrel domain protein Dabb [uncultured Sulfurovum sp.]
MVKHIVMFDFKEENKKENLEKAKEMLEALLESIPTLKSMEVGINFSHEDRAMDLSLYSEFDDKAALEAYAIHPAHLEVVTFIKSVAIASKVSDYTI